MTPADYERLRSWVLEIAEALLPQGAPWRDEGDERRFLGQGGLLVNLNSGVWFSHAADTGGAALQLIEFLKGCDRAAAVKYAEGWLASHDGTGRCCVDEGGTGHSPGNAQLAQDAIARLMPVAGTPAEVYLKSRGIEPPYPNCVKFLPDARVGEGAIVGLLKANGRVVGAQLGYLDPDGRKSVVMPQRRRLMLEASEGVVFDIATPPVGAADMVTDIAVAEGLEDPLSIWKAVADRSVRVVGVPGIGSLQHLPVRKGERIVIVRDGDEPGSAADKALTAGVDRLLIEGAAVRVTATPSGADANSILASPGPAALAELIAGAPTAEISRDGEIQRLARLSALEYERERGAAAKRLGLRVAVLDNEVEPRRLSARPSDKLVPTKGADPDLLDEVIDLGETLDGIVKELGRYVVAGPTRLPAIALWSAHTHLVHHPAIGLTVSPRLAVQAAGPSSGKTITLEAISCLVPKPRIAASVTASSVLRVIGIEKPTMLIDEADQILRHGQSSPELTAVLNASHRQATAFVDRSVPTPDGGWVVERFPVWCAMALASIGELPRTLQDRSIVVFLDKALVGDVPEHLEDGTSPELEMLRRRLATWASTLTELPRPALPASLLRQAGRVGDNWRPLLAIADLAGERWRGIALEAIEAAIGAEKRRSPTQRLLVSIGKAFHPEVIYDEQMRVVDPPMPIDKMSSADLLQALLDDPEEEWATANRGKPITQYWLRDRLRGLLDPPKSQKWREKNSEKSPTTRGYYRHQFEKGWRTHLADVEEYTHANPAWTCATSDTSATPIDNRANSAPASAAASGPSATRGGEQDDVADVSDAVMDCLPKSLTKSMAVVDVADVPDAPKRFHDHTPDVGETTQAPNGSARRSILTKAVAELRATHPDWSPERIARELGQPKGRIVNALERGQ